MCIWKKKQWMKEFESTFFFFNLCVCYFLIFYLFFFYLLVSACIFDDYLLKLYNVIQLSIEKKVIFNIAKKIFVIVMWKKKNFVLLFLGFFLFLLSHTKAAWAVFFLSNNCNKNEDQSLLRKKNIQALQHQ